MLALLAVLCLLPAADAGDSRDPAPAWTTTSPPRASATRPARMIRARGDRFEVVTRAGARAIFFRGVNLGAGAPGHFPGEFAVTKEDYRRWLRFARSIHANAVRVYALHPPEFYAAFREENAAHPRDPLWLFQEVWTELPEANDFWDSAFTRKFHDEIRLAIDAVHGNAVVRERPGHASGRYDADVSPWLAGWLLGREWEPYAVRETQSRHPDSTAYRGAYFTVDGGTAMEVWLARACDLAASYEAKRYGLARALSFVNWPTLDPMRHPTEGERGGREAEHDEDAYSVDPTRLRPVRATGPDAAFLGYFANYHVYPYYPDFMNLDPGYAAHRDRHGVCGYAGYLADLKAHTRDLPLLIGEYGVPSSRGIAHLQPQGIHHGGFSEEEQGERDIRLLEDIVDAGCAGSLLFALFDEWFKVNWLVQRVEAPRDRDPLWHNLLDPEESYGLIGFDAPPAVEVDGSTDDWAGIEPYAKVPDPAPPFAPLRALYVTSDQSRLYLRVDLAPDALTGAFDGPRRDPPRRGPRPYRSPPPAPRGGIRAIGVSLDMLDPSRGDHRLPEPLRATWSRGAEFLLLIEPPALGLRPGALFGGGGPASGRAALFVDRSMNYSAFSRIRVDRKLIPNPAPFRPVANDDGLYAPLLIETNRERVSRSGTLYPARHLDWGRLTQGEWHIGASSIEIAIPWGLLAVGDPSSRSVLDDREGTRQTEVSTTDGIGLLAWATAAEGFSADSLGPTLAGSRGKESAEAFFLGPDGTSQSTVKKEVNVTTPPGASYIWNAWDRPITRERIKRSAARVSQAFEGMEAREERRNREIDARNR